MYVLEMLTKKVCACSVEVEIFSLEFPSLIVFPTKEELAESHSVCPE